MISDASGALIWFLLLEAAGAVALPWAFLLFRRLPDRGLTLVKPAALLLFSYALWVFGLTHILPNTTLTVWAIFLAAAAVSVWLARRQWHELRPFLRRAWPVLLASELIFAGMFALWAFTISGSPAITHTEKPMDLMLLNAAYQTRFFPAEDLWLSGHSISYYYFGHIIMAFLAKLSGVAPSIAYNLGVASIPALAGAVAFGLAYNLVRVAGGSLRWALTSGAAAPVLILLAGNLIGALEFIRIRGWAGPGFWDWAAIKGLDASPAAGGLFPEQFWWWFRASRVIDTLSESGASLDYTITEFPAFSFVLGDLHGHVLAIPFLLLAVAATLNLYLSPQRFVLPRLRPPRENNQPGQPNDSGSRIAAASQTAALALTVALSAGALAFINFWDFPTFMALLAGALLLKGCRDYPDSLLKAACAAAAVFTPLLALSVIMFAPFYWSAFSGQTSGILPLQDVATRPFLLFIVLGLFILMALAFLTKTLLRLATAKHGRPEPADAPLAAAALLVAALPLGLWTATGFLFGLVTDGTGAALADLGRRLTLAGPGAVIVAAAGYCALALSRRAVPPHNHRTAAAFTLLLLALGFYLVMGAELFHIVDSFGGAFRRMNTVFKFYYQTWLLLGIVAAFAIFSLWSTGKSDPAGMPRPKSRLRARASTAARWAAAAVLSALLLVSFYYTVGAILERSNPPSGERTLDGLAFLRHTAPGEYAAIQWLRNQAPPGRILEAVGDDYTAYGRISAATGRPTPLGWKGHEIQWRGSHHPFAGRETDIAAIYSGRNPSEARRLLELYAVRYIYLGSRERETYGLTHPDGLPQYRDFLKTVFRQDNVIVYEVWHAPPIE